MTGHMILAAWAVGAFAAFPAAYETMARTEEEGSLSTWAAIGTAVVAAALWPAAWIFLLAFALRGSMR